MVRQANHQLADFTGCIVHAADQPAVDHYPAADAGSQGKSHKGSGANPITPPRLPEGGKIDIIGDFSRLGHALSQTAQQIESFPTHIGTRARESSIGINQRGDADDDRLNGDVLGGGFTAQHVDGIEDSPHRVRRAAGLTDILEEHHAGEVGENAVALGAPQIDSSNGADSRDKTQSSWGPARLAAVSREFLHASLGEQTAYDPAYGGQRKTELPGKLASSHRPVRSNRIKKEEPVELSNVREFHRFLSA